MLTACSAAPGWAALGGRRELGEAQARFPGVLGVFRHARLTEIEADDRAEEAAASTRFAREPASVDL